MNVNISAKTHYVMKCNCYAWIIHEILLDEVKVFRTFRTELVSLQSSTVGLIFNAEFTFIRL